MRLAIKNSEFFANDAALKANTGMVNLDRGMVLSSGQSYIYYASASARNYDQAIIPSNPSDTGAWMKDNFSPIYAVSDNYNFATNDATELDVSAYISYLINYAQLTFTPRDICQLYNLVSFDKFCKIVGIDATKGISPKITNIQDGIISPNQSSEFVVLGNYFDANTKVVIPNLKGTIDYVRVVSENRIEVGITTAINENIGALSVLAMNNQSFSTDWGDEDAGANALNITTTPQGDEKYLKIAGVGSDNYEGIAFAKSEAWSFYSADQAFDSNNGTRHYASDNQALDHYLGIILSAPTLLTRIGGRFTDKTTDFRLEGSSDTTTGHDGTWVDLGDYVINSSLQAVGGLPVYNAFRIVWINPDSNWAGCRELYLLGRQ